MKSKCALLLILLAGSVIAGHGQPYNLTSPDGNLVIHVEAAGQLKWSVRYMNQDILLPGAIAMQLNVNNEPGKDVRVRRKSEKTVNQILSPVVPVRSSKIRDHFNQLILEFRGNYSVEFRAYNDGAAYRFRTSMKNDIYVNRETVDLNFPSGTMCYFPEEESMVSHYERTYMYVRMDTIASHKMCSLPALFQVGNMNALITEADLYDYPNMFLNGTGSNTMKATFPSVVLEARPMPGSEDRNEEILKSATYIARTAGERTFPWRVCIIGNSKTLLETNLVYQLSRDTKFTDVSWIKPGKVAWDWYNALNLYGVDFTAGINTETYKYYIDFASRYGLEYIILDEGWSRSTTNITEANADVDIMELIRYGKSKGVGIILWMLWKPLDENLEEILKTYAGWGIRGIKVDFMQRADQYVVNYYERVAGTAARYKLLVDFHGAFKPSGMQRAYPNLISSEGVKGNENNKWSADVTPEHTVTLPFTRMVAGPMDFTPGALTNAQPGNFRISFYRPMSLGTRCHQVAMYVVFESPLQMLCDAPSTYYREEVTTSFISRIPTVWDETIALHAKVADYVAIARRRGDTWYVGAMTDSAPRELELDFGFLPEGQYNLEVMKDGINATRYASDCKFEKDTVDRYRKMEISLADGGGWAAIITKIPE